MGLQTFNIQGTNIKGVLPGITRTQLSLLKNVERLCGSNASGFGRLPQLTAVSIFSTNMSAECEPNGYCEHIDDALPWYAVSLCSGSCMFHCHVLVPCPFCLKLQF